MEPGTHSLEIATGAPIRIYTLIYNKTNVHTRLKGSLQVRDEAPRGFYISPLIGAYIKPWVPRHGLVIIILNMYTR